MEIRLTAACLILSLAAACSSKVSVNGADQRSVAEALDNAPGESTQTNSLLPSSSPLPPSKSTYKASSSTTTSAAVNHIPIFNGTTASAGVAFIGGNGTALAAYQFSVIAGVSGNELSFSVSDADSDPISLTCPDGPAWLSVDNINKRLSMAPGAGDVTNGVSFTCIANDGKADSAPYYMTASVTANAVPALVFNSPAGNADFATIGSTVTIQWTDADPDSDASIDIYYKLANSGACSDGTLIVGGISEDDAANSLNWDTSGFSDGFYYLCAVIDDHVNSPVEVYSDRLVLYPSGICTWVGDNSTDWGTASNWIGCTGTPDTNSESVLILAQAVYQPVLAGNTVISAFGAGTGGGTVTINAGVYLQVYNDTDSIQSNVTLKGATSSCTTCRFLSTNAASHNITIKNDATLTLGSGLSFEFYDHLTNLYVGTASAAGHLIAAPNSTTEADWPRITARSGTCCGIGTIYVQGTASRPSSVDIDGLFDTDTSRGAFIFVDYFAIKHFRNVRIDLSQGEKHGKLGYGADPANRGYVQVKSCANATQVDRNWTNVTFTGAVGGDHTNTIHQGKNIQLATNCDVTSGFSINMINPAGNAWGARYATDPGGVITWPSATENICLWTGTTSTDWFDPHNWDEDPSNAATLGCNDRSGVPDQFDTVAIPVTVNQPVIGSGSPAIRSISANAQQGGTLTIAAGAELYLIEENISSDVTVQGNPTTCSTCYLRYAHHLSVIDDATLTLGKGIYVANVYAGSYSHVGIGSTTQTGHLVAIGGTNSSEKPIIKTGDTLASVTVAAPSGSKSSVDINGLRFPNSWDLLSFSFGQNSQIIHMDDIEIGYNNSSGGTFTSNAIVFTACPTAQTDLVATWNNLVINSTPTAGYYNIDALVCTSAVHFDVVSQGPVSNIGWGSAYEHDDADDAVGWTP